MKTRCALAAVFVVLAALSAWGAQPCCNITAIDKASGRVTAVVKQTGRAFTFEVKDAATLAGLKVGQGIYANLGGKQVSLDGKRACCRIVAMTGEAPAATAQAATAEKKQGAKGDHRRAEAPPAQADETASAAGAPRARAEEEEAQAAPPARPAPSDAEAAKMPEEADENDGEPADPAPPARRGAPSLAGLTGRASGANVKKLKDVPDAQKILDEVERGLRDREIHIALVGGEKYMINKCFGLKASAGTFTLKLENPDLRLDGSGVKMTLNIPHVSMNALKIRVRPNTNLMKNPCSFSKRRKVGGSAKDVKLVLRFDPLLDLQKCKLGSIGHVETKWRIGNLNLKPLQNDLDRMAKNMIEDSLTYASNFNLMDRIVAGFNGAIGAQCKR